MLHARVRPLPDPAPVSQAQFAADFEVTGQTLRNWAARGMPTVRGADGRPKYPSEAYLWAIHWRVLQERGEPPHHLAIAAVIREDLEDQAREDPDGFVLVPLDPDHPRRRAQLERAAAGR